jgi:hypothetical protein
MDLSQSMRQLQGFQGLQRADSQAMLDLAGMNSRVNVNQLSQRDLVMLQNGLQSGMLGRSPSLMELQAQAAQAAIAQGAGQFGQLSGSAMLAGTVAALQQESGQLRSQWKSDVARLENELGQLRSAAACVLPQLAERHDQQNELRRTESNLQALVLSSSAGASPLQQALLLQGAATQGSMPFMQTAGQQFMQESCAVTNEREQLLYRIAELEAQRDEALRKSQMKVPEPPMPESFPAVNAGNLHEHGAMQLTEALLSQMRASNAAAENGSRSAPDPRQSTPQRLDALAGSMLGPAATPCSPLTMQDALAGTTSSMISSTPHEMQSAARAQRTPEMFQAAFAGGSFGPQPTVPRLAIDPLAGSLAGPAAMTFRSEATQDTHPGSMAQAPAQWRVGEEVEQISAAHREILQELERMEIELQKVRSEKCRLKEEKDACENAHQRDVSTLEAMLAQIMEDNKRLTKALAEADAKLNKINQVHSSSLDKIAESNKMEADALSTTTRSVRSVAEPALEPDIDRSSEFDRSKLNLGPTFARYGVLSS